MLGVVIPAHDEEQHIGACVFSVQEAARSRSLNGEPVVIVVVADACSDDTVRIATAAGATVISIDARNVGIARARGACHAMCAGARWLAFTDADSIVGPEWLAAQLAQGSDAVCGTIEVTDWGDYSEQIRLQHLETYSDVDGHRHVHGANLGVTSVAYRNVGGFPPISSSEDVALVDALRDHGALIAWSAAPRVVTSARRRYRAPGGFGETLARLELSLAESPDRGASE
jgi:glycosyltransferase involved in cell wall biosynthesis